MKSGPVNTLGIVQQLVNRGAGTGLSDMKARVLADPDRSDPFNLWIVLAVEARLHGKPGAWLVRTANEGPDEEIMLRLFDGVVEQIISNPEQDVASAAKHGSTV